MKVEAKFTFDKVKYDQDNDLHLVLKLKAPKTDWKNDRAPICVYPVIDVSGSMQGKPLDFAKQSAIKLVNHLSENDFAGIATFSNGSRLVASPMRMTDLNKSSLIASINKLEAGGGTDFSGGLLMGLKELDKADLPGNVIKRVIMLTDGQANQGVYDNDQLLDLLTSNMEKTSVSFFGYGEYANNELLEKMSQAGNGNYAFIESPDFAIDTFAKELGGLLSTYAQNINVNFTSKKHTLVEVISDFKSVFKDNSISIVVPEILSEELLPIVIKVKTNKQKESSLRVSSIVDVHVSYDLISKAKKSENIEHDVKAQLKFVSPGDEQKTADADLDKLVANAEMVYFQNKAEAMANNHDYEGAASVINTTVDSLRSRGLTKQADYYVTLGGSMDARTYSTSASIRTSGKAALRRGVAAGAAPAGCDVMSFIDTGNSVQADISESFKKVKVIDMALIGISGPAGSGKNTLANIVEEHFNFTQIAFADPIKRIAMETWGWSEETLWGPSHLRNIKDENGLSPREALQVIGTDIARKLDKDVWVRKGLRTAKLLLDSPSELDYHRVYGTELCCQTPRAGVLITDVRFTNEMLAIKENGGLLLRIKKDESSLDEELKKHKSETESLTWGDDQFDFIIDNNGTIADLKKNVGTLFSKQFKYKGPVQMTIEGIL